MSDTRQRLLSSATSALGKDKNKKNPKNRKKSFYWEGYQFWQDSNIGSFSQAFYSLSTALHHHLCLYLILVPHILYQIICKLVIWASIRFQIKTLSTTKFYNFLRSIIFI
jgi:hypothetical protein